jgi:hypothetical protein
LTSTPSHWPSWSQFYKTVSAKIYGLNLIWSYIFKFMIMTFKIF